MSSRWWPLAALAVAGCNTTATGYPFNSRAVYEAPRSGFRFEVLAAGKVAPGADLSDTGSGSVRFCPLPGSSGAALTFALVTARGRVDVELAGAKTSAAWGSTSSTATLRSELARAGYAPLDAAELEESARAIDGVLSGPKGTVLHGQSRALGVLSTRLNRAAPGAPSTPSTCGTF
jgi:hypothetical protein